jgi:hypothetical protein
LRGFPVVEVQRTRTGKDKQGNLTRPYSFGSFDILAVCMEPSEGRWDAFLYIPERWLMPRTADPGLIAIHQPILTAEPDIWTDDFELAVQRLRSKNVRPRTRTPLPPLGNLRQEELL